MIRELANIIEDKFNQIFLLTQCCAKKDFEDSNSIPTSTLLNSKSIQ